jgi:hypothetical protein
MSSIFFYSPLYFTPKDALVSLEYAMANMLEDGEELRTQQNKQIHNMETVWK